MIGILDYGMGNLMSVFNALEFLGAKSKLIKSPEETISCSHLVIPGVGAFAKAMANIKDKNFDESIYEFVKTGKPLLGICLGMQLLTDFGYEPEKTAGLGLIKGEVVMFNGIKERIPHMGWNSIELQKDHYIFAGVKNSADFYFVHSYYFKPENNSDILSKTEYGITFASSVSRENITGLQFHPEKSQKQGLKILENFFKI